MAEPTTRIEDIQERVRDFVKDLRRAGANDVADRIDGYAVGFTDAGEVRRAVAAIQQQLEYWRAYPNELPDLPIIHIAANRLEDTCKDALRSGVIIAARPSIRTQGKRNLTVALTALAAGGLMFSLPLVITMFGVDLTDPHLNRELHPIKVPQGEEASIDVNVLVETQEPAITRGVDVHIEGRCRRELPGGLTCRQVEPHEFGSAGKLPTIEIMLPEQAYGLLIGVANARVIGRVGNATVMAAAMDETPEGTYRLPLKAAFLGYEPEHCNIVERLRDACTKRRVGEGAMHDGLPVPTVVVNVTKGDPSRRLSAQKKKEAEEAEMKRKAEERAAQIGAAVSSIKTALDDTQKVLKRKNFQLARDRIEKLGKLFAPLDTLMVDDAGLESMPVEVAELRVRFDGQRAQLKAFEDQVFDQQYALVTAPENKERPDTELMADVARRVHIAKEYSELIFAAHADEMEKRLAEAERARQEREKQERAALEARCGQLPANAWNVVHDYLKTMFRTSRVTLGECLTPRIDAEHCWTVTCDFKETILTAATEEDKAFNHRWTFLLRNGQVAGAMDRLIARAH
ncbi:MAG TPA: hypothetical protein VHM19_22590 [Polyangiales bacterium]|nr:hypothetical protein [Polyangiales bacterium]